MALLEIGLLGEFQLRSADGRQPDLPGRKERALLAILALPPGQTRSREKLAGLLWSERSERQSRDSLKQALLKLKRSLNGEANGPLQADRDSVMLDGQAVTVDAVEFERLVREGTTTSLAQAMALYRGDLLEGTEPRDAGFEEWLTIERQRLRDLAREGLSTLLDRYRAEGERDRAGTVARRLLLIDPLREAAHRSLMQIYAEQGDTALALKQYQICRSALQDELGEKPEPETEKLYREIRSKRSVSRHPFDDPAPESADAPASERSEDPAPASAQPSIAVLPFANLSADAEQQHLADGITEDIITELSRYRSLLVIARNSCFQFRGPAVDLAAVRRRLGVRFVVEGSIRRSGARLRLTVQLVDAVSESQVWAGRYDREVEDVFLVQEEVARAVASTLEGKVAAQGAEQARRRPTRDWAAYDHLLQGREEYHRYRFYEAERHFARAIELDPGYAQAYALRAQTLLGVYWQDLSADALPQALECARKALSLDPSDPLCHAAMGFVLTQHGQREEAGPYLDCAMALNPTDPRIISLRAWWLMRVGRIDESLAVLDELQQRDPIPPAYIWEVRGIAQFQAKRYQEAVAAFSRLNELHAWDHAYVAACHAYLNQPAAAQAAVSQTLRADPDFTLSRYARIEGYTAPADLRHLLDGMRKAGLPA